VPDQARKGSPDFPRLPFSVCARAAAAQTLFAGWTRFADRCRVCGLDLAAFNVGDGRRRS
jgi:uncharacterized protein (DUF983 family)